MKCKQMVSDLGCRKGLVDPRMSECLSRPSSLKRNLWALKLSFSCYINCEGEYGILELRGKAPYS